MENIYVINVEIEFETGYRMWSRLLMWFDTVIGYWNGEWVASSDLVTFKEWLGDESLSDYEEMEYVP